LLSFVPVFAQNKKPTNLRDVLLAELKSTHNSEEWFVPANIAVKGLTAEQAAAKIDVTKFSGEFPSIRSVGIDPAGVRRIYKLAESPEPAQ